MCKKLIMGDFMRRKVKNLFVITSIIAILFICDIRVIMAENGLQPGTGAFLPGAPIWIERMHVQIDSMADYSCSFDESLGAGILENKFLGAIINGIQNVASIRDIVSKISRESVLDNVINTCVPYVKNQLKNLESFEIRLQEMVDKNEIASNDSEFKSIKKRIEDAKTYFETESERLHNVIDKLYHGYPVEDVIFAYYNGFVKPPIIQTVYDKKACTILGKKVTPIIKWIVDLIQISIPVIIVIMTSIDFTSVVLNGEDKSLKAATTKFVKRLIIGAVIIFLPMLVTFIIDLSGALEPYGVNSNELFCSIF